MADDLLSPLDLTFWSLDSPGHPMHIGAMAVFERGTRTDARQVTAVLKDRAARMPGLRMRVRDVWYPAGGAVWAADDRFDVTRHVRLLRLPGAGGDGERAAEVAELMARPMDRTRPPWEVHVLDGAGGSSLTVLVKLHHALADGLRAVQFGAALLDQAAAGPGTGPPAPCVRAADGGRRTLPFALPALPDPLRAFAGLPDRLREARRALGIGAAVVRASLEPPGPVAPPVAGSGSAVPRRLATAALALDDVRLVRKAHGGTVNDVVLAVVCGGLRRWMDERGDHGRRPAPRALVPVARRRRACGPRSGNSLSGYLLRLPVHDPDPLARLETVRARMGRNKAAGPDTGAGAVALLADGLPPLAHRLGAPLAGRTARRLFDLLLTNVPIPDVPLTLAGCPLRELYPIAPLAQGQSLAVAVSTYRGRVHIGLFGDGTVAPDLDRLAAALPDALAELTAACP